MIRLTWRQITRDATATAVQVGQALALARARRIRAADPSGETNPAWPPEPSPGRDRGRPQARRTS